VAILCFKIITLFFKYEKNKSLLTLYTMYIQTNTLQTLYNNHYNLLNPTLTSHIS
jgi:hypothetical protein